jgi:hypothetical protein
MEGPTVAAADKKQKGWRPTAGAVILRQDSAQPGLALLNRNSGQADLAAHTPADLFPQEGFEEALELTAGLPYSSRGPVRSPAAVAGAAVAEAASTAAAEAPSPLDEDHNPRRAGDCEQRRLRGDRQGLH